MKKLFEYGGKVSQQFFIVDTANIKAYDWFQSIKIDVLTDEEKSLVNQLLLNIGINDVRDSITMSDARCKFIATKLMAKYDDLKLVDIDDYTIVYQTLLTIYEKTFVGIDEIIRYINLLMGYSFSKKELTREEAIELRDLQNAILDIINQNINNQDDLWINKYIPSFIVVSLTEKFDVDDIINIEEPQEKLLDEEEIKKVRKQKQAIDDALSEEVSQAPEVDVTLEDIQGESKDVEKKDVEYKPKGEDLKKIRKFELYITNLQKLLDTMEFSSKDEKEIKEAIDVYKDLLNDVKKGNVYAVGGIVQMFSSPQIVDGMYSVISMFDNGGETNDSGTLKKFVFADGSSFVVHFDNDNGRMVNPKLYKVTEQERTTSILLNKKSLAEVAIDNMNEHNIPFNVGLIRLIQSKVFVQMFNGGGRFNFRIMKGYQQDSYPYYLWDANSGSIISDFKTEQDAMDYIQFATERAKDSQELRSLSMTTLVEEKQNELKDVENQIETNELIIKDYQRGTKSFDNTNETEVKMSEVYAELRELRAKKDGIKKDLAHFEKILNSIKDSESHKKFRYDDKTIKQNRIDALNSEIDDLQEIIDMLETQMDIVGENSKTWLKSSIDSMKVKLQMLYQDRDRLGGRMFGGGGQSKFDKLSNKVAKNYEGKKVPSEYQKEYGKTYSKEEAKEVGDKVASKVYRLQLAEKNKAKWGGKYAEGGSVVGYIDLSKEKNVVVNDSGELKDLPIIDIVKKNVIKQYPITIDGSKKAYDLIMNVYGDNIRTYEGFYVIMLNKANKPIYIYEHTKGGQESTIVDVQLVVSAAQKVLAKGVILVHNHPSGSIRPSEADIKVTKDLVQALKVFNVKVLDHIIATENAYYSFADEGDLPMARDGKKVNSKTNLINYHWEIETEDDGFEDDEKEKIKILRKKIDFDEVRGHIITDQLEDNTNLGFYKDGDLVMTIKGDWNENTDELDAIMKVGEEIVQFNYHPLDGMGGFDLFRFQRLVDAAFEDLGIYSAVVSIEGYEEYAEEVEGFDKAKGLIQDIKGNTRFQVVKGKREGIGKRVDSSRVVAEFEKGGMAKSGKKLNTNNEEEEYLTYAESQKKYHERAGTTSIKDKQKMAIDFVKENPEVLLLENGAKLDGVPNVEELAKSKSKDTKMAHGGRVSIEALKEMVGEKPKKLTNREKITMAKAKYSN